MRENIFARVDIDRYKNKVLVKEILWLKYRRNIVVCNICERNCHIPPGYTGICGNYANKNGFLYDIGYGILSAIESRPIEVKPLFHFYPNSKALTFSGWGCNFHCPWCQNYHLSMMKPGGSITNIFKPEDLVKLAVKRRDDGLCGSFNEPSIHLTFLADTFEMSKKMGLYNTIVSNGYMSLSSIKTLVESGLNGLNIDIKGCPASHKRELRGIKPELIFRNAKKFLDYNIHVEMVLLVVTEYNDSIGCLEWIIKMHIDKLGPDIPLHINRYYPSYKYSKIATPIEKLIDGYNLAKSYGVKYVYIGNIWDPKYETTYCPKCDYPLIIRSGYRVVESRLDGNRCRRCGKRIYLTGKVYVS